jgi:hypothetical protein
MFVNRYVKIVFEEVDFHLTQRFHNVAISSIDCDNCWRIRVFGLCMLRFYEKNQMNVSRDMIPKVLEILLNDCEKCSMEALKFFPVFLQSERTNSRH